MLILKPVSNLEPFSAILSTRTVTFFFQGQNAACLKVIQVPLAAEATAQGME